MPSTSRSWKLRLGRSPRSQKVACVLSGGGSRASFQLGALEYLYRNDPDFTPTIFVGASAGAILASALAQYIDRDEQQAVNQRLTGIWRGLTDSTQMFTPRPWLLRAEAEAPGWLNLMKPAAPTPPSTWALSKFPFLQQEPAARLTPKAPLSPLEQALAPDEDITPEWSLGTLTQLFNNFGKLPRIGSDLVSIQRGMASTKSMYRPGPVLVDLLDPEVFNPAKVRSSGITLRIAVVALESGALRFLREDGALVDRENHLFDPGPHPLPIGVLASSAIPAVFRPVPMGAETYVDGGVRENLPAQLAIEHLGADLVYVIGSKGVGVPARQSMREADLVTIVMRSMEILIDEAGRDELDYAATSHATVIQPELDVHDAMSVDPGLIAINMDYGWLRAAEQHLGLSMEEALRHRRIIALRVRCLRLEKEFLSHTDDVDVLAAITSAKSEMREAVALCDTDALPEGASAWWSTFESHVAETPVLPPWLLERDLTD